MKKHDLIQGSAEWLAFRQHGIGSSDIAAICGVSPFKKAIDVFNEKLSIADKTYETAAMTRG
ncbi:YqaJ viral recombinase family protein, partial [Anaplasma marginale]|uniref:YqaJ viral recombinase family protein n=1 Tax=Anaplasma marginale TaxID=770 RepID=UPI0005B3F8DC